MFGRPKSNSLGSLAALAQGAQQMPWQVQYADPNWRVRLTRLNPTQEFQFLRWAQQNSVPLTDDYDMRGFWLNGGGQTTINPNDGAPHYPDTYKTPLHESFSGESIYANPKANPPRWNDKDQLISSDGRVLYDERAVRSRR